jgi:hypothetical protein
MISAAGRFCVGVHIALQGKSPHVWALLVEILFGTEYMHTTAPQFATCTLFFGYEGLCICPPALLFLKVHFMTESSMFCFAELGTVSEPLLELLWEPLLEFVLEIPHLVQYSGQMPPSVHLCWCRCRFRPLVH